LAYDSEIDGVFDPGPDRELSRLFKDNPTIENYLKLRAKNPDNEIEVAVTGGLDWLLANDQLLLDNGIQPRWVAGALDSDHDSISRISLALLQKLADRKQMIGEGKTHLASRGEAISDSFVNYLIAIMLDGMSWNDCLEIPRDLIILIRFQLLGTEEPAMKKRQQMHDFRSNVVSIAASFIERGEKISMRNIAKILKVNVSTISRLFSEDELHDKASQHMGGLKKLMKTETPFAEIIARHLKKSETDK